MKLQFKTGSLLPAVLIGAMSVAGLISSSQQSYAKELPPQATYQAMLDYGKKQGWIALKNTGKEQFIYFSHLQTLHCRLKEIRYSINTTELDKRFDLVKCIEMARGVTFDLGKRASADVAPSDPNVFAGLTAAADRLSIPSMPLASPASHDTATFTVAGVPSGMLFVRNENGSHNPYEAMEIDDFLETSAIMTGWLIEQVSG